ncbi:MAG TPA: hypothetical protein ENO16_06635 [Chromatiales bacterium]|nr:hypothetical protein [Chromatiales bacterium]
MTMKIHALLKTIALAGSLAAMTACASTPSGNDAMSSDAAIKDAKAAVAKAKATGQPLWAAPSSKSWGITTTQKAKPYSTENVLIDAEEAAKKGDEALAVKLANLAKFQAEKVMLQAEYGKNAGPRTN